MAIDVVEKGTLLLRVKGDWTCPPYALARYGALLKSSGGSSYWDDTLRKWLEGELAVPEDVFLRCADIVNAHQLDEISRPTYSPPKDPA